MPHHSKPIPGHKAVCVFCKRYESNALRTDWETVVPKDKLDYIMGNPPFVGYSLQSEDQKKDILSMQKNMVSLSEKVLTSPQRLMK